MLSPSYVTHIVIQILLGTLTPIILLAITQMVRLAEVRRKVIYATAGLSDTHRHLRHALERRDRRSALLQELPRIHDLQAGICGG